MKYDPKLVQSLSRYDLPVNLLLGGNVLSSCKEFQIIGCSVESITGVYGRNQPDV